MVARRVLHPLAIIITLAVMAIVLLTLSDEETIFAESNNDVWAENSAPARSTDPVTSFRSSPSSRSLYKGDNQDTKGRLGQVTRGMHTEMLVSLQTMYGSADARLHSSLFASGQGQTAVETRKPSQRQKELEAIKKTLEAKHKLEEKHQEQAIKRISQRIGLTPIPEVTEEAMDTTVAASQESDTANKPSDDFREYPSGQEHESSDHDTYAESSGQRAVGVHSEALQISTEDNAAPHKVVSSGKVIDWSRTDIATVVKEPTDSPTSAPTDTPTGVPTTGAPTTAAPTTRAPTTAAPTTRAPTTAAPTARAPTTAAPTTGAPTTAAPTTRAPTTAAPTTRAPTTAAPTTRAPTTAAPTTRAPTTAAPTTRAPTTSAPTTRAPTTSAPTTRTPTTNTPTEASTEALQKQAEEEAAIIVSKAQKEAKRIVRMARQTNANSNLQETSQLPPQSFLLGALKAAVKRASEAAKRVSVARSAVERVAKARLTGVRGKHYEYGKEEDSLSVMDHNAQKTLAWAHNNATEWKGQLRKETDLVKAFLNQSGGGSRSDQVPDPGSASGLKTITEKAALAALADVAAGLLSRGLHKMQVANQLKSTAAVDQEAIKAKMRELQLQKRQSRESISLADIAVQDAKRREERATSTQRKEGERAARLQARALKQEAEVRAAERKLARTKRRELRNKAALKLARQMEKDTEKLKASTKNLETRAKAHKENAVTASTEIAKEATLVKDSITKRDGLVAEHKAEVQRYRVLVEAYGGEVISVSDSESTAPGGKAAELLNRIAQEEANAAQHEDAAAHARAKEAEQQQEAARELRRVQKYSEYLTTANAASDANAGMFLEMTPQN